MEALEQHLGDTVEVVGANAGMHLMVRLHLSLGEHEVVEKAEAAGVAVYPAGPYYCGTASGPALVLGYAGMEEDSIQKGVARLGEALRQVVH